MACGVFNTGLWGCISSVDGVLSSGEECEGVSEGE